MSFSEFTTHPTQICSTQPKQPKFSIYSTEKKLKQCKQLILTNSKNILTERFQQIQCLQPNFITDGIRNFMAQQQQRTQLHLTNDKNIFLTVSNQYNTCNLILRLMP